MKRRFLPLGIFLALSGSALWFLLFLPYLPTVDLPHHAAVTAILQNTDRPEFGSFYRADWGASPYLLFYGVTTLLAHGVGAARAVHLFVALTMALYLVCIWQTVRRLHAPFWCALLAFPVLFHSVFFWGFAAFHLSLSLSFLGFLLLFQSPLTAWRSALLCGLGIATSLTHAYGSAFFAFFLGLAIAFRPREWRVLLPPLLIPIPLMLIWMSLGSLDDGASPSSPWMARLAAFWDPQVLYKLQHWKRLLFWGPAHDTTAWVFATTLFFLSIVLVTVGVVRLKNRVHPEPWARYSLLIFFVANALGFLCVAEHVGKVSHVCLRNGVMALATLPLLVAAWIPRHGPRAQRLFTLCAATLAIASLGAVNLAVVGFSRENVALQRVVDKLPPGARVLAIAEDRKGEWFSQDVYLQQAYYAQAEKGGWFGFSFAWAFPHIPIKLRDDAQLPRRPGPWSHYGLRWFDPETFGRDYDVLIIHGNVSPLNRKLSDFHLENVGLNWQIAWRRKDGIDSHSPQGGSPTGSASPQGLKN